MYQPKVSNTEKYSNSQGEHVVCRGKLVFTGKHKVFTNSLELFKDTNKPIIISETEEIEEGDWSYSTHTKAISKWVGKTGKAGTNGWFKILALPEHFSDKHLQASLDGKMKDGDEVLVKCEQKSNNDPLGGYAVKYHMEVHLDQQNHITLFPAKQSLDEAAHEYAKERRRLGGEVQIQCVNGFKAGAEWAKKNNYGN